MTTLERYLKHERLYVALLIAGLLLVNNTITATSILMEADRAGISIPVSHPFISEYTSAISILVLIPVVIWFYRRFPLVWGSLRRNALAHVGFSVLICVAHIALFVVLRKILFGLQGVEYKFSNNLLLGFVYEYRKDAWSYAGVLAVCGARRCPWTAGKMQRRKKPRNVSWFESSARSLLSGWTTWNGWRRPAITLIFTSANVFTRSAPLWPVSSTLFPTADSFEHTAHAV